MMLEFIQFLFPIQLPSLSSPFSVDVDSRLAMPMLEPSNTMLGHAAETSMLFLRPY